MYACIHTHTHISIGKSYPIHDVHQLSDVACIHTHVYRVTTSHYHMHGFHELRRECIHADAHTHTQTHTHTHTLTEK